MNTKRHSFSRKQNLVLKYINFHFKTPTKQILVIFQARLKKSLIWQKSSATWKLDFKSNLFLENTN